MMKQVLQNLRTGATSVVDVPVPSAQQGMVLVKIAASLVSAGTERMVVEFAEKSLAGKARSRPDLVRQVLDKARREGLLSTLEAAISRLDQPMPLGYSSAGTVVSVGAGVKELRTGQRVACAGGGYAVHAEYNLVPFNLVVPIPDSVSFEAAAFTTLGSIALHGFRLAKPQLGERVAVIGLGLLGLLTVGIARAAGCSVFGVDLNPDRVQLANSLGATAVIRESAEQAAGVFSRGKGCDAILICADTPSADPVELAGSIARDRARVVAIGSVGLQIPRRLYFEKELSFINSRSYGPGRYDPSYEEGGQDYPIGYVRWTEGRNLLAFVDLLGEGKINVDSLITHRFALEKASEAYALITGKRREPFLGVLLTYTNGEVAQASDQIMVKQSVKPVSSGSLLSTTGKVNRIRIGVLGAGNFANAVMLPVLKRLKDVELVGIASGAGMHAQSAAQKFGFRYATSRAEDIIQDPEINTIAILTRHHLHASQVLAGLAAGKHVFCEKPLALEEASLVDIEGILINEVDHLTDQEKPLLMVGFNRRFAPLAIQMKHFLAQSQEPKYIQYRVNAGYIPLTHWVHDLTIGGGRLIGEGCHFVDFLTFLVGNPPEFVSAQDLPDSGRYHEDNVVLQFRFPDGSVGIVSYLANGDKAFSKERVEAFSGGCVAVLDDYRSLELVRSGRRRVFRSRLRQDKGHQAEWVAYSRAILTDGAPPIPYDQVFGVTRASFASVESLRHGRGIVIQP